MTTGGFHMKMINTVNLEKGIRTDWNESYQLISAVAAAVEAYEEVDSKKKKGYFSNLMEDIEARDNAIRKAAHAVMNYSMKYQILKRPINLSSFQDCVKVLRTLGEALNTISQRHLFTVAI